jgi:hypothetical protein
MGQGIAMTPEDEFGKASGNSSAQASEVDDWEPVGTAQPDDQPDDWQPVGGAEPLPRAFMDRVRAGDLAEKDKTLDDVHDQWGRPGPLFQTDPFELAAERVRRRYPTEGRPRSYLGASPLHWWRADSRHGGKPLDLAEARDRGSRRATANRRIRQARRNADRP